MKERKGEEEKKRKGKKGEEGRKEKSGKKNEGKGKGKGSRRRINRISKKCNNKNYKKISPRDTMSCQDKCLTDMN
jgi:hypothetical protein